MCKKDKNCLCHLLPEDVKDEVNRPRREWHLPNKEVAELGDYIKATYPNAWKNVKGDRDFERYKTIIARGEWKYSEEPYYEEWLEYIASQQKTTKPRSLIFCIKNCYAPGISVSEMKNIIDKEYGMEAAELSNTNKAAEENEPMTVKYAREQVRWLNENSSQPKNEYANIIRAISLRKYNDIGTDEGKFLYDTFKDKSKLKKTKDGEYYAEVKLTTGMNRLEKTPLWYITRSLEKNGYGYIIQDDFTAVDKTFEFIHAVNMFEGNSPAPSIKAEKGTITQDLKRGAQIQGERHANGGTDLVINGKPTAEAEVGEAVINREATALNCEKISEINQSAGNGVALDCDQIRKTINQTKLPEEINTPQKQFP